MITILFWFIIFYLLFRFIFNFVVPLISTTKQVRSKMKDMHQSMNDFQKTNTQQDRNTAAPQYNSNTAKGDYIDFEEIK